MALLLIEYGADPNISNFIGHTALMNAADRGNVTLLEALLRKGARGQFHQHFKSSFCADNLAPKKYKPKI